MKLLLTSSGISNDSTKQALAGLPGKPIEEYKALFYAFQDVPIMPCGLSNPLWRKWAGIFGHIGTECA
jgi:hypothetical protein